MNYDLDEEDEYEGGEEEIMDMGEMNKHSSHYWREMAKNEGRAFCAWFTLPEYLIEHILVNVRPDKKTEKFSLKRVVVENVADVKEYFDPKTMTRNDPYDGDYYDFKEIQHGRWILRGSHDQNYEMFPERNRGRQAIANCYTALAFAHLYTMKMFRRATIDSILKYGDRLHTFTNNLRRNDLKNNKELNLKEEEIEEILGDEPFGVDDLFKTFAIGDDQVSVEVEPFCVVGEINAQDFEDVLDVRRGLDKFFAENKSGILCGKDLCVAVFRGEKIFYMFDPNSRGPCGVKTVNGKACVTRYLDPELLTQVFLKNLEKEGKNFFAIHKVCVVDSFEAGIFHLFLFRSQSNRKSGPKRRRSKKKRRRRSSR